MSTMLETIMSQLGQGGGLQEMSRLLGKDEKETSRAASLAVPALLGALARNASRQDGAASLAGAIDKDHDGGILNDVAGFLGNAQAGPGEGILRHVLGERRPNVEANVSRASGLDSQSVGKLMTMLAPVVMGMLGQEKRRQNMDAPALAGFLNRESTAMESAAGKGAGGFLGALLDADGDGDFDLGDIAKKGAGLLGNMFRGK